MNGRRISTLVLMAASLFSEYICTVPTVAQNTKISPVAPRRAEVEAVVKEAYEKFKSDTNGKNADYIPYLAKVDSKLFGIAIVTTDNQVLTMGDVTYSFSIQSISKVYSLALAMNEQGPEKVLDGGQELPKFLGWVLNPKMRYFLYAWTSNASQGQPAQVVLAGNLNYRFNDYFTLSGGIRSLPGTRSVEGNFPFWLGVDTRLITDEFFRPSYTSGVWASGNITKTLQYQAMVGNNLSTLGVSAAQLDNKFNTVSSVLIWQPTGDYGLGFGDFEDHQKLATRFGGHYTSSTETAQEQPNSESFENNLICTLLICTSWRCCSVLVTPK
jgi:hypothetical protein